jgi:hypothetical protein
VAQLSDDTRDLNWLIASFAKRTLVSPTPDPAKRLTPALARMQGACRAPG